MADWFSVLPRAVQKWLFQGFLQVARRCPGHRQGESIYCANCGLRMDSIQRAQELGALEAR